MRRLAKSLDHDVALASRVGTGSLLSSRAEGGGRRTCLRHSAGSDCVCRPGRSPASLVAVVDDDPAAIDAMARAVLDLGRGVVVAAAMRGHCSMHWGDAGATPICRRGPAPGVRRQRRNHCARAAR